MRMAEKTILLSITAPSAILVVIRGVVVKLRISILVTFCPVSRNIRLRVCLRAKS